MELLSDRKPSEEMNQGFHFPDPVYGGKIDLFIIAAVVLVVWIVKRKKK